MQERYAQARAAAWLGIISNIVLSIVKLGAGIFANSFALVADAVHSLSDMITSAFVLIGLHISERPSDSNHPYGHTKAEAIAGSNVALMLLVTSIWMTVEAFHRFHDDVPVPGGLAMAAAIFSIIVKEGLYQYKSRVGKRVGSMAVLADAWHHRTDAFSSVCVFIGLGAIYLLGPDYAYLDSVAAGIVGITIFVASLQLYKESLSDLMDAQVDGPIVDEIRETAVGVDGVYDIEELRVRKAGMEYSVDIHVEVDAEITTDAAHDIASKVRDTLVQEIDPVRQVLVHIEPHTLGHEPGGPHTSNCENNITAKED